MTKTLSHALLEALKEVAGRYPRKQAALLPVLHLVQKELGAITPDAERDVAEYLDLAPIRVHEAVTFYSLFLRRPIGRFHIQVCRNLSCSMLGAAALISRLAEKLGIGPGETTHDGMFSLSTVECLGLCDRAPCLLVNDEVHGDLDPAALDDLIEKLRSRP